MDDIGKKTCASGFLVYVRSCWHVTPQWWRELYFGERNHRRASVVAIFELDASDAGLSLDELALRHPLNADPASPVFGGRHE